jgi:predicted alpha/beta-hydrolase family hydrolase
MSGHVIVSHGLDSSPESGKATALAKVAGELGWTCQVPDYRPWDQDRAHGRMGDVGGRILHLLQLARAVDRPLVLAGSSMGAFVSARVSMHLELRGLFLMAPPVQLEGHDVRLEAASVPIRIVHGWDDELIPAMEVARWAQSRRCRCVFVDDSHRLSGHVEFCAEEFRRFLLSLR